MDLAGYMLERLREDNDFVLYRGRKSDHSASILVFAPASRETDTTSLGRLEHEHALAKDLDPKWAIQPVGFKSLEGQPVLLHADPGGHTLDRLLTKPMDLPQFLDIAVGIASALRQMHACGLIHKDIKPTNIFVDVSGNVRLTGFGFATRLPREHQAPAPPEVIPGTLAYMAPEQTGRMNRSIDNRSDLYALGVTLYEMLVGALPFTANDPMEYIFSHIARVPPPPSIRVEGVPRPLDAIILKLLAKNAEDRYQTAAGVEFDLRHCQTELRAKRRVESFRLGERDLSGRLLIPEKLYGRETEIELLARAFDRVSKHGKFEFLFVSGYSGVGKSSIVTGLHTALYSTRSLFAVGKVDRHKSNIPYATLAQALHGLLRLVLMQDDAELDAWRNSIQKAVGSDGQLLIDLMPDLRLILGDQPKPPNLSADEEKQRFHAALRQLISAFAKPEHPLILFIDDMQWLDAATLDLLSWLATEDDIPYLLLIGAYRSNVADSGHDLEKTLGSIRTARGGLSEIELAPLSSQAIAELIADTLHAKPESIWPLADLVYEKTQGNPFFAVQFLTTLDAEGLLEFDNAAGTWRWDIERVKSKRITDNVAELIVAKLARFGESSVAVIKQLACLGSSARTETLSRVLGVPEGEVDIALREFVGTGLLHAFGWGYTFAHDGVRDAAYALIPADERPAAHLEIGRLLSRGSSLQEVEDDIFEIANQYNRGSSLISSQEEAQWLAELNLNAGKRAKSATAYEAALTYLDAGCALLWPDSWEHQYRTIFDLEYHRADCKFVIGEIAYAEERLAILFERSADFADRALVVGKQVVLYTYLGQIDRAIVICIECLARMGVVLPVHPTDEEVEQEYRHLIRKINDRAIESFVELPAMTDPHWRQVMSLLAEMLAPAGILIPNLLDLTLLRMTNISLDQGNTDESCHSYVNIGGRVLPWRFGNPDAGHRFGQLALRLIDERGLDRYAARAYAIISGIVAPWTGPLKESYDIAMRALAMPRERGGVTYSGYAWVCAITALLGCGSSLSEVEQDIETALAFARKTKFYLAIEFITTHQMFVRSLRGQTTEFGSFNDTGFVEEEYESYLEGMPNFWHAMTRFRIRKLQLRFYAGDYVTCLDILSKVGGNLGESPVLGKSPVFEIVEYCFFSALARAAALDTLRGKARALHFKALKSSYDVLVEWAKGYAGNFAHRVSLVAAEIARLESRELDAERHYEDAIRLARDYGFGHNEGLANELAGRFYAVRGFEIIAEAYLRKARLCYSRWGADGKVNQLERLYPNIKDEIPSRIGLAMAGGARYRHLDMEAVVQMYQAVSKEIVLERLIERLMVLVVEQAGAVRGLLLLPMDGRMRVAAEAITNHDAVVVSLRNHADTADELPQSVLNYVTRTQDFVIIDDAQAASHRWTDDYIAESRPRSILCLPLLTQKRLVGVLYLENDLSSNIFTPDRVSVLQLLASQAAISIENAKLFLDIKEAQDRARRVGDELRRSFDMIPALAWRASPDGSFEFSNKQWHDYTGISHEEARGRTWLRSFHPDDVGKVMEKWRYLLEFRTSGEFEARMRRFDGEFRSFLIHATPLRGPDGDIINWHGTCTDIENLKRVEQAQEALARVSRVTAMGEVTVSIAHEVNQPLMAIVTDAATCLRWLAGERPNIEEARLAAERIVRDGHRAGEVIKTIRAMARKSSVERVDLDLNSVILEVLTLTRNELERHAITVDCALAEGGGLMRGDRVQMQQVILNLIMNGIEAIKSTNRRQRTIIVRSAREPDDSILVTITDTGIGLDQTGSEQIFEAFFTTKPEGMGVGLSICRSIIESHGGRLWASPNIPHGTTFHFTVPAFASELVK